MLDIFLTAAYIAIQHSFTSTKQSTNPSNNAPQAIEAPLNPNSNILSAPQNQDNKIQTTDLLTQLNADLTKQKIEEDPFANKKVKIDIESLGLDEINDKSTANEPASLALNINQTQNPNEGLIISDLPKLNSPPLKAAKINTPKPGLLQIDPVPLNLPAPAKVPTEVKPKTELPTITSFINSGISSSKDRNIKADNKEEAAKDSLLSKLKNLTSKKELVFTATNQADLLSSQTTTITKAEDKKILDANINQKSAIIPSLDFKNNVSKKSSFTQLKPKAVKINRQKLEQLKKEYLTNNDDNEDENWNYENKKIIPRKKEIINFSTYEVPPPLMARAYDNQNLHTPVILNREDKINLLFKSITKRNPAYFDSAYEELREPNLKNSFGDTLLTYATLMQRHDIMVIILSKGADPDLNNNLGYNAMNIAIELSDYRSMQILIEAGAKINHKNHLGQTYLMQSVITGFLPIIDLLITNNIDINAIDDEKNSALDIARKNNKNIVTNFLIKKGAKN
jgi:ankyrin repeat protein